MRISILLLTVLLPLVSAQIETQSRPTSKPTARKANRLALEQSPYLRQHAHNPVDWFPWGPEAFAKAKKEDKAIFLSIGYAACHWCHVMEHESFEDPAVAAFLNQHFVAIKVDREERPDVDQIYMDACRYYQRGRGGWPLTALLTPDLEPFFAGTYYPKKQLMVLLERSVELWKTKRKALLKDAKAIRKIIASMNTHEGGQSIPDDLVAKACAHILSSDDKTFGGFGGAPKFPRVSAPLLLLRRSQTHPDPRIDDALRRDLDAMAKGGLRDHLQGGFHRYSVDQRWFAPHFEKMLYDQALLAQLYLEAGQALKDPRYLAIAKETLDQVLQVFATKEGSFISALDADTEGVEGATYTWKLGEIRKLLSKEESRVVEAWSDIDEAGNWEEGRNILFDAKSPEEIAKSCSIPLAQVEKLLASAKTKLLAARALRPQPRRDTKVLCEWNALMVSALAKAAPLLGPSYLDAARQAMSRVDQHLRQKNGRYLRSRALGVSRHAGGLQDHAAVLLAKLDLYQATLDDRFLDEAHKLAGLIAEDYWDPKSGALADSNETDLIVVTRSLHDGARPSGISLAIEGWARLSQVVQEPVWAERARKVLLASMAIYRSQPAASPQAMVALDLLESPSIHVTLSGQSIPASWIEVLGAGYRPQLRLLRQHNEGAAKAVVCVGKTCLAPAATIEELKARLMRARKMGKKMPK